ncbi:unnamed protein product, partial [Anisakis simplex]|uniref:50S ribosomal protein L11 methyltransferase n=1 Tax=Anisakis simplex TaxID=6269 RepID=A0A0M3JQM5_ANISI
MEAVITIDVLRRAGVEGLTPEIRSNPENTRFQVTVAGLLGKGPVRCARQTVITPEVALSEAKERK